MVLNYINISLCLVLQFLFFFFLSNRQREQKGIIAAGSENKQFFPLEAVSTGLKMVFISSSVRFCGYFRLFDWSLRWSVRLWCHQCCLAVCAFFVLTFFLTHNFFQSQIRSSFAHFPFHAWYRVARELLKWDCAYETVNQRSHARRVQIVHGPGMIVKKGNANSD